MTTSQLAFGPPAMPRQVQRCVVWWSSLIRVYPAELPLEQRLMVPLQMPGSGLGQLLPSVQTIVLPPFLPSQVQRSGGGGGGVQPGGNGSGGSGGSGSSGSRSRIPEVHWLVVQLHTPSTVGWGMGRTWQDCDIMREAL